MNYSADLISLRAMTNHGEFGYVAGPAFDPARCTFQPLGVGTDSFAPLVANLTFECVPIMRANRLATEAERAYAWDTLMAYSSNEEHVAARAIEHAAKVLGDRIANRLSGGASS